MLTPNFSSTQSTSDPRYITFVDSSTGSDGTIDNRQVTVTLADGTTLVPPGVTTSYFDWSYLNSSVLVNLLAKSASATVEVVWLSGNSPVYTKTIDMTWYFADILFLFNLLSFQTSNPKIINDTNYYSNAFIMITNLQLSGIAITDMDDVYSSQGQLDKNQYYIQNQNLFF